MVPRLTIYGATAFTAQNLLTYLDGHPDLDGFDFILSGRNAEKLDKVNAKLLKPREVVSCDLTDQGALDELVKKGEVVLNNASESANYWKAPICGLNW